MALRGVLGVTCLALCLSMVLAAPKTHVKKAAPKAKGPVDCGAAGDVCDFGVGEGAGVVTAIIQPSETNTMLSMKPITTKAGVAVTTVTAQGCTVLSNPAAKCAGFGTFASPAPAIPVVPLTPVVPAVDPTAVATPGVAYPGVVQPGVAQGAVDPAAFQGGVTPGVAQTAVPGAAQGVVAPGAAQGVVAPGAAQGLVTPGAVQGVVAPGAVQGVAPGALTGTLPAALPGTLPVYPNAQPQDATGTNLLGTYPIKPEVAQVLSGKCIKVILDNFKVNGVWINEGDNNPLYPQAKRCILVQA